MIDLHVGFAIYALIIAAVSIYYIREHIHKLDEVEW